MFQMSQRLSKWWRFTACVLPVLINRLPAAGLGGWHRVHSTACVVASGQALILQHQALLCFTTDFVSVWSECCSRLAHLCLGILLPACGEGVIVTKWRCWLSPERLGPSRWSTQLSKLGGEGKKKKIKSDICLVSDALLILPLSMSTESQFYCREWRFPLLT